MKVLLTGGLGYIGSHTAVCLLENGYDVAIIDNLSNSKVTVKDAIEKITNKKVGLDIFDLCDKEKLDEYFKNNKIDAVIHFAGLKAVGESVSIPLKYYENNLTSTINLIECMQKYNVNDLIFSSSATVYGGNNKVPFTENMQTGATNPYGRTKLFIEEIIKDVCVANSNFKSVILRYFNPVGAHESGLIGENPNGKPNNLMPFIARVATGKLDELKIFGNDYPTIDGTGVRDYIHVCDLASGHVAALKRFNTMKGYEIYNLGTGKGISVLEMVNEYNTVCGNKVKYSYTSRRDGDIAECYASSTKAEKELGWKAKYTLKDMCKTSYNYEIHNK